MVHATANRTRVFTALSLSLSPVPARPFCATHTLCALWYVHPRQRGQDVQAQRQRVGVQTVPDRVSQIANRARTGSPQDYFLRAVVTAISVQRFSTYLHYCISGELRPIQVKPSTCLSCPSLPGGHGHHTDTKPKGQHWDHAFYTGCVYYVNRKASALTLTVTLTTCKLANSSSDSPLSLRTPPRCPSPRVKCPVQYQPTNPPLPACLPPKPQTLQSVRGG